MTPETFTLAERAKRTRMEAIRLCQETDQTLSEVESLRVTAAWQRSELGKTFGLVEQVHHSADMRDGAGL
jgi:hypothetical protein